MANEKYSTHFHLKCHFKCNNFNYLTIKKIINILGFIVNDYITHKNSKYYTTDESGKKKNK